MVWDAADHLRSLKTPNQVALGAEGKSYVYEYFPIGNLKSATDPLGNTTKMDYTFNKLNKLTAPDGTVVRTVWNPQNLKEDTNVNQTIWRLRQPQL